MLFEEVTQREFEREEFAGADRKRIVDDAGELGVAAVRTIEADVGPRPLISLGMRVDRILAGPLVVRVPGVVGALERGCPPGDRP